MSERYVVDHINISSEDFDGETVCVNFATGTYFGMNETAGAILDFFGAPHTKQELQDFIVTQFGVEKTQVSNELDSFIESLIEQKLILQSDGAEVEGEQKTPIATGSSYEPPRFEIYTDLQELIMLDPVHDTDPERGWPLRRADLEQ